VQPGSHPWNQPHRQAHRDATTTQAHLPGVPESSRYQLSTGKITPRSNGPDQLPSWQPGSACPLALYIALRRFAQCSIRSRFRVQIRPGPHGLARRRRACPLSALPLDANYRRVPGPDELGSWRALSTVVHASGCAPLSRYVLLDGFDTYASRQPGQSPASHARSAGRAFGGTRQAGA
jgi:hypothetical protein